MLQAASRWRSDPFIGMPHRFLSDGGAVALTDAVLEAGVLDIVQAAEFLAKELRQSRSNMVRASSRRSAKPPWARPSLH